MTTPTVTFTNGVGYDYDNRVMVIRGRQGRAQFDMMMLSEWKKGRDWTSPEGWTLRFERDKIE